jgi:hypothetical protein
MMATTIRARIYARGEVSFAKFLFLPIWFAKLFEANFSCFAKIIWMPSWFVKLLELLTHCAPQKKYDTLLLGNQQKMAPHSQIRIIMDLLLLSQINYGLDFVFF